MKPENAAPAPCVSGPTTWMCAATPPVLDASAAGSGDIIEAQIPAQLFEQMGFKEGETLLLTPRKARVFVA